MSYNHTFRHAGSYKYWIALAFVKPRGGEGQKGRLKCSMGFLVSICVRILHFLSYSFFHAYITIIIQNNRESHRLQGTRAIILRDKHPGFCSCSSPGLLSHSFLGLLNITEGGPMGPHWPISRINPTYLYLCPTICV